MAARELRRGQEGRLRLQRSLALAADEARTVLGPAVAAQASGDLPAGDTERVTVLLLAVAHGAVDLALSGQLARHGTDTPARRT